MMRGLMVLLVAVCGSCLIGAAQKPESSLDLPMLHHIKEVTLSPSFSCRPSEEVQGGYKNTALFLSDFAKRRNEPDLLFNGACDSEDYFEAATAGDNMSLIADLGDDVALEEISASRAFNLRGVHQFNAYSGFARVAKVQARHTYAVLLNANDKRGLFVFTVEEYEANKLVRLRYAVKSYQVSLNKLATSIGFSWEQKNVQ